MPWITWFPGDFWIGPPKISPSGTHGFARILAAHLPDVPLKEPDPLLAEGKPTQPHPSSSPSRLSDLWEAQILLGGRWIFEDGSNIPKAQIHPDSDSQRSSAIAVALRRGNHSYLQISYRCFPFFLRLAKYHKWLGVVLSLRAQKKAISAQLRPMWVTWNHNQPPLIWTGLGAHGGGLP